MRLIDADELLAIAEQQGQVNVDDIINALTVDAKQVVHCEDCTHCELHVDYLTGKTFNFRYCYYWKYEQGESPNLVDADDFCSYGELKK